METFEIVLRLFQVGIVPVLLLIWNELKDTRRTLEQNSRQIVRLEEQIKFATKIEERIHAIEVELRGINTRG